MPFLESYEKSDIIKSNEVCRDFIINSKRGNSTPKIATPANDKPSYSNLIELPKAMIPLNEDIESLILNRKSTREYNSTPMTMNVLSTSLSAAFGYNARRYEQNSNGSFPLKIFPLILGGFKDLKFGLYEYVETFHSLEKKDSKISLADWGDLIQQSDTQNAKVAYIIVGNFKHAFENDGAIGYRKVFSEAGHFQALLSLVTQAMGYGYFDTSAGLDREIEDLLNIDGLDEALVGIAFTG